MLAAQYTAALYNETSTGSGVLVHRNWLLTAKHVVMTPSDAIKRQISFDLLGGDGAKTGAQRQTYAADIGDDQSGIVICDELDICFIRLFTDRFDRLPPDDDVPIATPLFEWPLVGSEVVVIGHPKTTWLKRSLKANVQELKAPSHFIARASNEVGEGFSGGAVAQASTGLLLGIAIRSPQLNRQFEVVSVHAIAHWLQIRPTAHLLLKQLTEWTEQLPVPPLGNFKLSIPQPSGSHVKIFSEFKRVAPSALRCLVGERNSNPPFTTAISSDSAPVDPAYQHSIGVLLPKFVNTLSQASLHAEATAIVVGRQWILTAHHAIDNPEFGRNYCVIFGLDFSTLRQNDPFPADTIRIDLSFDSDSIVHSDDGTRSESGHSYNRGDWALIKLQSMLPAQFLPLKPSLQTIDEIVNAKQGVFIATHFGLGSVHGLTAIVQFQEPADSGSTVQPDLDQILLQQDGNLYHKAAAFSGCSGAPLLLSDGKFIGIHIRSDVALPGFANRFVNLATNASAISAALRAKGFDLAGHGISLQEIGTL